jgi:hypothetical protein
LFLWKQLRDGDAHVALEIAHFVPRSCHVERRFRRIKKPSFMLGRETQYCSSFRQRPPRRACLLRSSRQAVDAEALPKRRAPLSGSSTCTGTCRLWLSEDDRRVHRDSGESDPPDVSRNEHPARREGAVAPDTALPRLGTRANPMPHTPNTRRQAVGGSDSQPKALAGFHAPSARQPHLVVVAGFGR